MTELRRRKLGKDKQHAKNHPHKLHLKQVAEEYDDLLWRVLSWVNLCFGVGLAVYIAFQYSKYVKTLHENDMWFSNIKQVEREISFRTEAGLYFSYYKQLVLSKSISQGLTDLTRDNKTEHLRTINILKRFNVYQEVVLAAIYKMFHLEGYLEYVFFYINTIFGLHGMYMMALYVVSWALSGTWISGLLATAFYILNKSDTTRLTFTIPLRESFSLPFIYVQLASITIYLKNSTANKTKLVCLIVMTISTVVALLTWQFAQFVLLLESFALFGTWCLGLAPKKKVQNVFFVICGCLILACVLHYNNDMLLSSLALHFSLSSLILFNLDRFVPEIGGIFMKILRVAILVIVVFAITLALNFGVKRLILVDSDEHIFKFVMAKLGYGEALKRDFDSLLYLCEGAFQYLPLDTFARLTDGVVFPCYVVAVVVAMVILVASVILVWSSRDVSEYPWILQNSPEIAFTIIQTVFFGLMALSTLRMKFLWTPHICITAAGIFCHQPIWRWIFFHVARFNQAMTKLFSYLVPVLLLVLLLGKRLPGAMEELKSLREFYDPDTVELMTWINENTKPSDSFTGSMQLLAGVKLCTDRPITNHPHYENKFLRQRTKEVYQIYARKSAKEVREKLKKHGSNFIILENSICYSRQEQGCRLIDILDADNGDDVITNPPERFCNAIRYDRSFAKYFRKVFENRTFYVYKVL